MKVLTVVGARPQFVKASAVSRALAQAQDMHEILVHTGQHHDDEMSAVFFRELDLRQPDAYLGISGGPHGRMTGRMLERLEAVMVAQRPDAVLVYGDTNSTLAGALAAAKLALPVVHVEAGMRSFTPAMPEEVNRVVTDRISSLLCCPTRTAVENLRREGLTDILAAGELASGADLDRSRRGPWVANVGDVMLDVLLHYRRVAAETSPVLARFALAPQTYVLLTIHRAESATRIETLRPILDSIRNLTATLSVVFPMHPRTRATLVAAGEYDALARHPRIMVVDPLSYLDFLQLEANARAIITDSGGVQKEACYVGVPCVTVRNETEWPETVAMGWNRLVGIEPVDLASAISEASAPSGVALGAFGQGDAAVRIVDLIRTAFTA